MSDKYMTLLGAEQVQSAANTMRSAAEDMQRAASSIDETFRRHHMFMDDWLSRLEAVLVEK
jgi:predicted small secreted protein